MSIDPAPLPRNAALPPIPLDYDRLEPLYEIQSVLAGCADIEDACEAFLPIITRVLAVRTVVLIDTAQGAHREFSWSAGLPVTELEEAQDYAWRALSYLAPDDRRSPDRVRRTSLLANGVRTQTSPRNFVALPFVLSGRTFGVFQIEGATTYNERDLLFINVLVNQVAVAVDRHHVSRALETARADAERASRRLRELQAISDVALRATLDDSLATVADSLRSMFDTDAAAILLASKDGQTLRCRSLDRLDGTALEVPVGVGVLGQIAAGTTALRFDQVDELAKSALVSSGACALLGAPMHVRGHLTGVVYVASHKRRDFTDDELQLVHMVAERIGIIIDNASLYEQALAAIRSRDVVIGFVSHDLTNPLSTIALCTDLIETNEPSIIERVAIIKRSIDVMVRLISDLRDVGNIEAGRLSIRTRPESATSLVGQAIEGISSLAIEKSLQVTVHISDDRVLECDRTRVVQVLTNLLSNAVKFTPRGGAITLSMTEHEGKARISVQDTGPGIAPAEVALVFDRYRQANAPAHLGTGLGLAIAKGIVDAHGGTISVESRVGHGSTFSFTLDHATNEPPDLQSSQPSPSVTTGARVLVVDDDLNALDALASLLELEGFRVTTAANGVAALLEVHDFAPDVLVVDIEMPELKGDDLARKIRIKLPHLPVILMSGHGAQLVSASQLELGASYVAKPLDIDELVSAIHRALGRGAAECDPHSHTS